MCSVYSPPLVTGYSTDSGRVKIVSDTKSFDDGLHEKTLSFFSSVETPSPLHLGKIGEKLQTF